MEELATITFRIIDNGESQTALRSLNVWITLCEIENLELEDLTNSYVLKALGYLVPLLTSKMIDPNAAEEDDPDDYTLKMASQIALSYVAQI